MSQVLHDLCCQQIVENNFFPQIIPVLKSSVLFAKNGRCACVFLSVILLEQIVKSMMILSLGVSSPKSKEIENLTVATGHGMMGMSLGPATGKLVSEIMTKQKPSIETRLFALQRF